MTIQDRGLTRALISLYVMVQLTRLMNSSDVYFPHSPFAGHPIVNDPLYNNTAWGPKCGALGKGTENMDQVYTYIQYNIKAYETCFSVHTYVLYTSLSTHYGVCISHLLYYWRVL